MVVIKERVGTVNVLAEVLRMETPGRSRMYSLELFKLTDFIESMGQESPTYSVICCLFHLFQFKSTQPSNVGQRLAVQVKVQQQ